MVRAMVRDRVRGRVGVGGWGGVLRVVTVRLTTRARASTRAKIIIQAPAHHAHASVPASFANRFCSTAVPSATWLNPVARWKYSSAGPKAPHMPPLMDIPKQ